MRFLADFAVRAALAGSALFFAAGCGSTLAQPFDQAKAANAQITIYRLQNYEPPPPAPGATNTPFVLPPQLQQWVTAGASLLPPGLLPPGLSPGSAPPPAQ